MTEEPPTTAQPGGAIGRYRVIRRLGAGAFATVWLGHDPEFDVDVAIKVLAENWAADAEIRERFVSEAKFLRRIRDRRVVHVYDIGTLDDGRPYFVMDYLDAGSLEDLRRMPIPPAEALRLCAEAARGLEVLHRHHLVHRDVTPRNLLLSSSPDGSRAVVVADLGVARSVVDSSAGSMIVGTPSYMAPEQAGSGVVDHRADVYALTAVAFALLTQNPPFRVDQVADLATRSGDAEPPPVAASLGAPATLDGLFRSGLATDPHRRPPTAALLAEAFDQVAGLSGLESALPHTSCTLLPGVTGTTAQPATVHPAAAPPTPVRAAPERREGRSAAFYVGMTVLAVVLFAAFVTVVLGLSL